MIRFSITLILCYCFEIISGQTCTNWLSLPSQPSAVEIGNLNIPGNQVTVEALISRTTSYTGGLLYAGDIVSKHNDPTDVNYLLRPNTAEITTTNGYFRTPDICEINLNKTYHVAMVYDGATLKFYRNGFLMSQVAATGDLFQNSWPTRIGYYFNQAINTNFIGYINEVRIWNVARSQAQIQAFMTTSLPTPATQPGLLAYYTFSDLLNKQGNAAWNGTIVGSAAVNQPNPTCSAYVGDSCCATLQGTLTGGSICLGSNAASLTFSATTGTPPFTLTYSDGTTNYTQSNVQSNTPFNLASQPTTTTNYSLTSIQDASPCPATTVSGITATINVLPLPQGGIAAFNAVCAIDSAAISFVSTAGTAPFQLVISDGTNTTTYYGIMPGVPFKIAPMMTTTTISLLSVTDEDGNGCTRSAGFITPDALISVSASPVIVFDTVGNVCIDKSTFLIDQAKETSGLAGFGIFSGDGIDASGNFSAIQAGLGTHNITYTFAANNGCSAFKSQNITVVPDPVANAGNDLIDCMGVSVQLNASGGKNYLWTPADGLSNPAIPNPMVTASATTTYTVMVTDSNGCSASDSVTVVVSAVGKAIYVLPNAFTPNGDGKNDCFGVSHWGGINLLEFSIYNRWGQLVFATKNTSECWGGVYNGTMQDAGTYVYVVRANTPCGDINLRGTVILIR